MAEDAALTRFANSEIHQNVAETNASVNLRFVVGKRVGVASSGRTDDEGLRRLAEQRGRDRPGRRGARGLGRAPRTDPTPRTSTPATARRPPTRSPEFRADGVRAVIAAADAAGVTAYGSFSTGTETIGRRQLAGRPRGAGRGPSSQLLTVSMGPDGGTGYAEAAAVDATTIDAGRDRPRGGGARPARPRNAVAIDAGDYPVVLEEYAVVDLLDMLGYLGFSRARRPGGAQLRRARQAHRQRPRDDRRRRRRPGRPADVRSTTRASPSSASPLVERGICREVVYDAQTAARDGVASTGHGLPAPNPWGPFPLNMVMAAGDAPARRARSRGLDRGLLVTRFHYTNPVHPKLAIVTGMTRDGTFLVEDGKIVGPVRNLRFTQSYLDALAGTAAVAASARRSRGSSAASSSRPSASTAGRSRATTEH